MKVKAAGPDLSKVGDHMTEAEIHDVIVNGRGGMPAIKVARRSNCSRTMACEQRNKLNNETATGLYCLVRFFYLLGNGVCLRVSRLVLTVRSRFAMTLTVSLLTVQRHSSSFDKTSTKSNIIVKKEEFLPKGRIQTSKLVFWSNSSVV